MTEASCSSKRLVQNQMSEEEEQIDRLSNLPESLLLVILSLLPIEVITCISVLSHRLHDIWKAIHLIEDFTRHPPNTDDCSLLRRNPSYPITHLTVRPHDGMTGDDLASLLLKVKAQSLSLRHLKVVELYKRHFDYVLPVIFSFDNLLSLSFGDDTFIRCSLFLPSCVSLTRLKTLTICLFKSDSDAFNELVARLYCLEELFIKLKDMDVFKLTSQTVKKLDLTLPICDGVFPWMCRLSVPKLEFLGFKISTEFVGSKILTWMPHFWGVMPRLRNAFISIDSVRPSNVPVIHELLTNLMNVENLKLDLAENYHEMHPFHMMLNPRIKPPMFPHLKSLDLSLCFHDGNMEDLIELLQNCPVLESLKLVHRGPNISLKGEKKLGFKSSLPQIYGNNEHAYFCNLHVEEKREEMFKLLTKKKRTWL